MSLGELANHMMNKIDVLFADIGNSIHDVGWTFEEGEKCFEYGSSILELYYIMILIALVLRCRSREHRHALEATGFLVVLNLIGFTMAYMLVEVMNRYISMPMALLLLILCGSLPDISKSKTHK